jgi:hypothetical protein
LVPARAALAWGSDCLAETAAHLRNYTTRLRPDGERRDWILCAAASFDHYRHARLTRSMSTDAAVRDVRRRSPALAET